MTSVVLNDYLILDYFVVLNDSVVLNNYLALITI